MSEISRQEFAAAVASAISSVHHVYREVDRLIVGLRELLAEEPSPLMPVRGTLGKSGRDPSRLLIRNEYGDLFRAVAVVDEVDEEEDEIEDELEEEQDDEDGAERKGKSDPAELVADEPLLAVQVALYDPKSGESFEPQITYAVMNDWKAVNVPSPKPGETLLVPRYLLKRIPRALGGTNVAKGGRLMTRASIKRSGAKKGTDRRISCRLPMGAKVVPLYALDKPEELAALAAGVKQMWADALKGGGR